MSFLNQIFLIFCVFSQDNYREFAQNSIDGGRNHKIRKINAYYGQLVLVYYYTRKLLPLIPPI